MQFTLQSIATLLGGTIEGDPQAIVSSFGRIEEAIEGQLTFLANPKYEPHIYTTRATATLVSDHFSPSAPVTTNLIRVADPYAALAQLMQLATEEIAPRYEGVASEAFIHPSVKLPKHCYIAPFANIAEGVTLGEGCSIYPYTYIGKGCKIGEGSTLYPHVTIYPGCEVGARCTLHAGAVIGADGFGFAPSEEGYKKIPQLGNVVLADDVEIGANTCIDRAVMDNTVIRRGVKLDNLIQIAHNCEIGEHTVMASQVGLAGSSAVGKWCRFGGQVGIGGHLTIGDRVEMAGQTGVLGNVASGTALMGSPGMPLREAMRSFVIQPKLPDMYRRLQALEKELAELKKQL